jgi:hypothetical protein
MGKFFRTNLGPHFSEGTRQTWLKLRELGWSLARTSAEIGAKSGVLHKILYGDREPNRSLSTAIKATLGVEQALWDAPPVEVFLPPAAVVDESAQPSAGAEA